MQEVDKTCNPRGMGVPLMAPALTGLRCCRRHSYAVFKLIVPGWGIYTPRSQDFFGFVHNFRNGRSEITLFTRCGPACRVWWDPWLTNTQSRGPDWYGFPD